MTSEAMRAILLLSTLSVTLAADTSLDWVVPSDQPYDDAYPQQVGDTLTLNWGGPHNVMRCASESEYTDCTCATVFPNTTANSLSKTWTEEDAGQTFYMICGVGDHCDKGQKIKVVVAELLSSTEPPTVSPSAAHTSLPTSPPAPNLDIGEGCGDTEYMRSYGCQDTTLLMTYYHKNSSCEGEMVGTVEVPTECASNTPTLHCPGGDVTHPHIVLWENTNCTGNKYSHPWSETLTMPLCETTCEANKVPPPQLNMQRQTLLLQVRCLISCPNAVEFSQQYMAGEAPLPSYNACNWMHNIRNPAEGEESCTEGCTADMVEVGNQIIDTCASIDYLPIPTNSPSETSTPTTSPETRTAMPPTEQPNSALSSLKAGSMFMFVLVFMVFL